LVGASTATLAGHRLSRRAWAAAAAVVIVALAFWAALSHRVYNHTLPLGLLEHLFGEDDGEARSAVIVLRKVYSIAAFTLIGLVVHLALPPVRRPALRAAIIVAAFSAVIEIAQKLRHAHEGLASNAIDIACGAVGGWLAVRLVRSFRRRA
jgi:uncharacterized BrkB/YihY/UPF0761 family membrane protein